MLLDSGAHSVPAGGVYKVSHESEDTYRQNFNQNSGYFGAQIRAPTSRVRTGKPNQAENQKVESFGRHKGYSRHFSAGAY